MLARNKKGRGGLAIIHLMIYIRMKATWNIVLFCKFVRFFKEKKSKKKLPGNG